MAEGGVIGAPKQEIMDTNIQKFFGDREGLLVKQTMRGCCAECMGCETKSEFKISDMKWDYIQEEWKVTEQGLDQTEEMYSLEASNFCCRCCWRDGRPFNMQVSAGAEQGGEPIVNFAKPCSCPLYFTIPTQVGNFDCPCCCMLPHLNTTTASGTPLGSSSRYICDINLCVPKLEYSEYGSPVYILKPETCCCGCCMACSCCSGKGALYLPFYFHDPASGAVIGGEYNGGQTPQIRKMWAGLKKELLSTADTFAVMFPKDASPNRKAGLLGLTFLLDFTLFERQHTTQ